MTPHDSAVPVPQTLVSSPHPSNYTFHLISSPNNFHVHLPSPVSNPSRQTHAHGAHDMLEYFMHTQLLCAISTSGLLSLHAGQKATAVTQSKTIKD